MLARRRPSPGQAVLEGEQRIAVLEDLDRRVAAVGVAGDLAVVAVLQRGAAGAHAVEVVVRVVAAGLRVDAAEEEVAARAAARRRRRARGRPGESAASRRSISFGCRSVLPPTDGPGMPDVHDACPAGAMNCIGR